MDIRFVSSNEHKIAEVQVILKDVGVNIIPAPLKIEEIQTEDVYNLVRDKLLQAFWRIGRPVFVEHTGLYIQGLNNFPGGLTQIFWDKLQAETFSSLLGKLENPNVTAKTIIGYCDSRKIYFFEGSIAGIIAPEPRGPRDFQWDCVFIPEGYDKTFAEMGDDKNNISMRKLALTEFCGYLAKEAK